MILTAWSEVNRPSATHASSDGAEDVREKPYGHDHDEDAVGYRAEYQYVACRFGMGTVDKLADEQYESHEGKLVKREPDEAQAADYPCRQRIGLPAALLERESAQDDVGEVDQDEYRRFLFQHKFISKHYLSLPVSSARRTRMRWTGNVTRPFPL